MFVYIHVPFCQSRCIYCDFYVELEKYGGQDAFVDGLLKEIDLLWTSPAEALAPIKGLYVGGGTPSLLSASDYEKIFNHIEVYTSFEPNAEITLEANPLGMKDSPKAYLNTGFNRISLGVQSFNDIELKKLSRIHTMNDAIKSVKQLERAGFKSISIDLMYGTPLQTLQSWKETLRYAVGLEPQHISLYGLKVEDKTPLEALVNKGFYAVADDDLHIDMLITPSSF